MKLVDLTSNFCIDKEFRGRLRIREMIAGIESDCKFERQRKNDKELFCEQVIRCEYGICCDLELKANITSQDAVIVNTDYARIHSLTIKNYKIQGEGESLEHIQFLPVTNNLIRNLIHYEVSQTSVKTIGEENFEEMVWLEILILSNNLIETVPSNTFQGLIRLERVDLSKNFFFTLRDLLTLFLYF